MIKVFYSAVLSREGQMQAKKSGRESKLIPMIMGIVVILIWAGWIVVLNTVKIGGPTAWAVFGILVLVSIGVSLLIFKPNPNPPNGRLF